MKYGTSYGDLNTLDALNTELQTYEGLTLGNYTLPLAASAFTMGSAVQTASDVDKAVAASDLFVYNEMELKEVVDAVNEQLVELAKPPPGYTLYDNAGVYAYVKGEGDFGDLNDDDINLLVDAANNLGKKTHNSSKCSGNFGAADAYIHNEAVNRLFSFKRNGNHSDGKPMVTVIKQGKVNSGTHQF
jgi:hypothetical protein